MQFGVLDSTQVLAKRGISDHKKPNSFRKYLIRRPVLGRPLIRHPRELTVRVTAVVSALDLCAPLASLSRTSPIGPK